MTDPSKGKANARCACGAVEIEMRGTPITSIVCYCDDCQEGSRQIEGLDNAPPVRDEDGGTEYDLYRKDRVSCSKGAALLKHYKILETSATNRSVATCCNSAMLVTFDDGKPWVSVYRRRVLGQPPPLEMRIYTKFNPKLRHVPSDVPSYSTFPLRFATRLVAAKVAMLLYL